VEGGHELRHSCNDIIPIRSLCNSVWPNTPSPFPQNHALDKGHLYKTREPTKHENLQNTKTSHVLISWAFSLRSTYSKIKNCVVP